MVVWKTRPRIAGGLLALGFAAVLTWWFSLEATNEGPWKPNNERTARPKFRATLVDDDTTCGIAPIVPSHEYSDCWHDPYGRASVQFPGCRLYATTRGSKQIGHPMSQASILERTVIFAFSLEVPYRPGEDYTRRCGFWVFSRVSR